MLTATEEYSRSEDGECPWRRAALQRLSMSGADDVPENQAVVIHAF
jgi:hypothetical protein